MVNKDNSLQAKIFYIYESGKSEGEKNGNLPQKNYKNYNFEDYIIINFI